MPAIIEYPQVVREAMDEFGDLFSCEPQRRHFAEYLTGLMVAANKTVTGINGEFVETTDQSCLNRFLTEAVWDEQPDDLGSVPHPADVSRSLDRHGDLPPGR